MTEPDGLRHPTQLADTVLDPGRVRRFPSRLSRQQVALAQTVLDPGRHRARPSQEWPGDGKRLPDELAERFKLIRRLEVPASQAALYLVRERETGAEVVLKRTSHAPHPDLVSYLCGWPEHVVQYLEFGEGYEVMEYLPGGSLRDRQQSTPGGFDFATLHALTQQVASVLIDLHRRGLAHRDIKPANLMLRTTEPLNLVVVDFGIAGPHLDQPRGERLNPAYQPPEWSLRGEAGPAGDWWALGMTLVELASGRHPFAGLTAEDVQRHFTNARLIDVAEVPDEPRRPGGGRRDRLRSLCQGLLAQDMAQRWDAQEVGDWLVGRDPQPPQPMPTPPAPGTVWAEEPFVFNGVAYHVRDQLAVAMAMAWNHAVAAIVHQDDRLQELRGWLRQLPDGDGANAAEAVEAVRRETSQPGHVRLERLLRALHPTRPATYRNHLMARHHLAVVAHRALANDGDTRSVLAELWTYRLLPSFDTALRADNEPGGEALADLDRDWREQWRRLHAAAGRVGDSGAQQYLAHPDQRPAVLALCLRAALRLPADVANAQETVRAHLRRLPAEVPWFGALAKQPELVWLALLLSGRAMSQARTQADVMASRAAEAERLRASASLREWSRRQNRPAALGWAVAGLCLLGAGWIALITGSDAVGWAGDSAIGLAWVAAAVCAAASLVVECLLAVEVGGRFHPRFSMPGAGVIGLRPLWRWMRRAWLSAAVTVLGALGGIALIACWLPQAVVAGTTVGHLAWAGQRWRAWRLHINAERALIAEAAPPGPSDTEAVPAGTAGGAQT